jgi:hypothetical protein
MSTDLIERMLRRQLGARRAAAARLGMSLADYDARTAAGEKWCTGCKAWHPVAEFTVDQTRGDGYKSTCRTFSNAKSKVDYRARRAVS